MASKLKVTLARRAEEGLEKERFYQRVMVKWLKGYSVSQIEVSEGNAGKDAIIAAINIKRGDLKEAQRADIEDLIAERIGGLRQIQSEAHEYIEFMPEKAPQLLTVALRAEEAVAKIQGVLSEKVLHLGRIQHEFKMYDFKDNLPPPLSDENNPSIIIQEPELPPIDNFAEIIDVKMLTNIPAELPKPKPLTVVVMKRKYVDLE